MAELTGETSSLEDHEQFVFYSSSSCSLIDRDPQTMDQKPPAVPRVLCRWFLLLLLFLHSEREPPEASSGMSSSFFSYAHNGPPDPPRPLRRITRGLSVSVVEAFVVQRRAGAALFVDLSDTKPDKGPAGTKRPRPLTPETLFGIIPDPCRSAADAQLLV